MIKKITFYCLFLFIISINSQTINFTDANFKTALLNHSPTIDTNSDGEIQETEASDFTDTLDVSENNITDITGIEFFTNITTFYCSDNLITSIDMSSNSLLVEINADNNMLTSFNISENVNLENLYCSNNETLTEINVTQNSALLIFWCRFNQLTGTLDLSNAVGLTEIICNNNDLIIINLANGNNTNISTFNLDFNPNLEFVYVDDINSIFASFLAFILPGIQITTDPDNGTVSLESNTLSKYISVYPNPTTNYLYIETDKNINNLEIFDLKGNLVLSKNKNNISKMSLYNLTNGVYFCKIEDDQGLNGFIKIIKK